MPRPLPPITTDIAARFWTKVNKTDSCWLWTGATNSKGYGMLGIEDSQYLATRISWLLQHGDDPGEELVLHDCPSADNPACVNPGHLYLGTHTENMRDCHDKGQRGSTAGMRYNRALSRAEEEEIKLKYRARRVTLDALANEYGTSKSTVSRIINGYFDDGVLCKSRRVLLTSPQVQEIKGLFLVSTAELSRRYGVSATTILRVRNGYYD